MWRTHKCDQLRLENIGQKVILAGWVYRRRDLGALIFVDLRDGYGLTQIVFDPVEIEQDFFELAQSLRSEFVIKVEGSVRARPKDQINENLQTGEIEVYAAKLEIINHSPVLPFVIDREEEVGEEIRLEHRYLDLRRERMRQNIKTRHKVNKFIRDFMDKEGFSEIETPMMIKGTPEGSREYVIPSRVHQGQFYVLPQSPQQLKQLLMIAGFDRYFQIVRCFRDEDLRGDRQPEFTQLDMEMSFEDEDYIMQLNEKLAVELVQKFKPEAEIKEKPFPKLTYAEAMNRFGSDKPDLRFGLEITDVSDLLENCAFSVFSKVLAAGGVIKALRLPDGADLSRKELAYYEETAKIFGAKGLAYLLREKNGELKSSIGKFLKKEELNAIMEKTACRQGDAVFFAADHHETACKSLGAVRSQLAKDRHLIPEKVFAFAWITDFPLFERDEQSGALASAHHPFTAPQPGQDHILEANPSHVLARAYDLVLNGSEIAGGSIRIHDQKLQARIFDILGIKAEERERRFGHLLKALSFGAPPHGGIAWGLDRFLMILREEPNIREVIAFPKDQKGRDLMLKAPGLVAEAQLTELGVKLLS